MSQPTATARVKIEVEVTLSQPWGPEFTIKEIHRTGVKEAVDVLTAIISRGGIRLIGATACDVVVHMNGKP